MSTERVLEVELRGPLSQSEYRRLYTTLMQRGIDEVVENRLFLDYTTPLEGIGGRELDIRARITNGQPEIIAKKGKFGGPFREEASLLVLDNSLVSTLRIMSLLGYKKAVACDRGIRRMRIDDIELSIHDVRYFPQGKGIHSRFFEIEILCQPGEETEAEKKLRTWAKTMKLSLFQEQEWNAYVAKINEEANGTFDYDDFDLAEITKFGQAPK